MAQFLLPSDFSYFKSTETQKSLIIIIIIDDLDYASCFSCFKHTVNSN